MRLSFVGIAALGAVLLAACGANSQGLQPSRAMSQSSRAVESGSFAHGAELEKGAALMVSEGNQHAAFPPGATLKRTADGIEVTYKGVTRTFSSNARVDIGTYHRYAKPAAQ